MRVRDASGNLELRLLTGERLSLMTLPQVQTFLGVSRSRVYQLEAEAPGLTRVRIPGVGRAPLYLVVDVENLKRYRSGADAAHEPVR